MLSVKHKSFGFTLIELLVVILVILSVGVLITGILFSALRGSNKTKSIDLVRRNGNSAITQMSRMIRYSQSFGGMSIDGTPNSYIASCVPEIAASSIPFSIAKSQPSGLQSFWENIILRFESFQKKELAGIVTNLAALIPKFGAEDQAPQPQVAGVSVPTNLGWDVIGGSVGGAEDRMRVSKLNTLTVDQEGVVSQGKAYMAGYQNSASVSMIVYLDNGSGIPNSLIATSNPVAFIVSTPPAWYTFTFPSSFNVTAGQTLWIGNYVDQAGSTVASANGPRQYFSTNAAGNYANVLQKQRDWGSVPVPNPFGAGTDNTAKALSAYLIVNPPPATPTPTTPPATPTPTTPPATPTPTTPPATPTLSPTPIPYHYVRITGFDGGETIFHCDSTANFAEGIASNSASLIDTNSVDVSSCYFTCSQDNISSPPNIGINFTLTQKGNPQLFENRDSAYFQTSVSVRNY